VRGRLAALAAGAAFLHAAGASADVFYLTSPYQTVLPPPPLKPGTTRLQTIGEIETPGRVTSREHVVVGLGHDGTPVRVTVTQRLRVTGTGDYSFVVPAPATTVARGRESDSLPGLRDVGIVWQGFSDRRRVLSATATLRPRPAAAGLPLRVRIARRGGGTIVRLENVARRRLPVLTGRVSRARLDEVLVELRARFGRSQIPRGLLSVSGEFGRTIELDTAAPLRVTGTVGGTRIDTVLGRGRPLARTLAVRGAPDVRLRAQMLTPLEILPTPRELARARHPVEALESALGSAAIARAYGRYVDTPDPIGRSEASFLYRSVPARAAGAARVRPERSDTLTLLLVLVIGAGGACALAAVWARS